MIMMARGGLQLGQQTHLETLPLGLPDTDPNGTKCFVLDPEKVDDFGGEDCPSVHKDAETERTHRVVQYLAKG